MAMAVVVDFIIPRCEMPAIAIRCLAPGTRCKIGQEYSSTKIVLLILKKKDKLKENIKVEIEIEIKLIKQQQGPPKAESTRQHTRR
jgi:hypothetical protein